jgi:hypothetical protein
MECVLGAWQWCGMLRAHVWCVFVESAWMSSMCCFCLCCAVFVVVLISLAGNMIGDDGTAAIAGGLHDLSLLTSLKYVIQA